MRSKTMSMMALVLAAMGVFLAACRPAAGAGEGQPSPAIIPSLAVIGGGTATPSASPAPSASPKATPSPTATISAPTPTPDWSLDLDHAHPSVDFSIPLMTQHVTPGEAVLFFQLGSPAEGRLFYWRTDLGMACADWAPISTQEQRQQIYLEGLIPGVEYSALIGLRDGDSSFRPPDFAGERWGPIRFHTPGEGQEVWRVGVVGDSGFGEALTVDLVDRMAAENLDFVIHTGDLVYKVGQNADPPSAFRLKFLEPFAPILRNMPLYPVVGNHDWDAATAWGGIPYYYWVFPGFDPSAPGLSDEGFRNEYYAFAYGEVQFLMLNTQVLLRDGQRDEQIAWLSERLADDRFRYSIPVFHVPPYTSGLHTLDGRAVREYWQPLFERAKVPLVLSGHDHNYERIEINGIAYIVSGGGSSVLYALRSQVPGSQVFVSASHYLVVEFSPQQIHLQAKGIDGGILDDAVIPLDE
jgi:3',5'-cyclic AMP phosphodiesterase CpdA